MFTKKTRGVRLRYLDTEVNQEREYQFIIVSRTNWGAKKEVKRRIGYLGNKKNIRVEVV